MKDGPERILENGNLTSLNTYRDGVRHGRYENQVMRGIGASREVGEFANGKEEGVFTRLDSGGNILQRATWRNGVLDGPFEALLEDGKRRRLEFSAGYVVTADGRPIEDRLRALIASNKIDSPQVVAALTAKPDIEFFGAWRLKDAMDHLTRRQEVRIVLDSHFADPKGGAISGDFRGIYLSSVLAIMSAQSGHGCDYRYGSIWITSAEDARDWHDPTGVADILPPQDSQLAQSWDEQVVVEARDQPLADVLKTLTQPLAIGVDTSAIEPAEKEEKHLVTLAIKGHPFRHTLGMLLYDAGCRCELRGDTLVVLPPE